MTNAESIKQFFVFADDYAARGEEERLRRLVIHFMGELFLSDTWWFNTPPPDLARILTIAIRYPESITAFFDTLAKGDHYPSYFSTPMQWLTAWEAFDRQPEHTAQFLTVLCQFKPGKHLVEEPSEDWWPTWIAAITPLTSAQVRELCENLWVLPMLSESINGFWPRGSAEIASRAAIGGISAVADTRTIELLTALPLQKRLPIFIRATAIISLGRIADPAALLCLRKLERESKGVPLPKVVEATIARVTAR
jgi:hypothetical protein